MVGVTELFILIISEKSLCILSRFRTLIVTSPCRMKMNKHAPISSFEVCAKVGEHQPALNPKPDMGHAIICLINSC